MAARERDGCVICDVCSADESIWAGRRLSTGLAYAAGMLLVFHVEWNVAPAALPVGQYEAINHFYDCAIKWRHGRMETQGMSCGNWEEVYCSCPSSAGKYRTAVV